MVCEEVSKGFLIVFEGNITYFVVKFVILDEVLKV